MAIVRWVLILLALGIATWAVCAPSPITLTVYPPFSMVPGGFRVRAMIERHEANRGLFLEYDGPMHRSSYFQIDGAQRQRMFQPTNSCACWTDLVSGNYIASATLIRMVNGQEKRYVAVQAFQVLGGF